MIAMLTYGTDRDRSLSRIGITGSFGRRRLHSAAGGVASELDPGLRLQPLLRTDA